MKATQLQVTVRWISRLGTLNHEYCVVAQSIRKHLARMAKPKAAHLQDSIGAFTHVVRYNHMILLSHCV